MKKDNYYTDYVTKKEFCLLCNVSESTAYKLIKNYKIKYEKCCDGLLHHYKIPISEVERFLKEKAIKNFLSPEEAAKTKRYYIEKLRPYPEVMSSKDIIKATGYSKEGIRKWIKTGKIEGIIVARKFCVAKCDLITFLLGYYYNNIIRKSDIHRKDLEAINCLII